MRVYELALVLKPSLSAIQRKKIVTTIKNSLKNLNLKEEKEVGERSLSYEIQKEKTGYYMDFLFEGEGVVSSDFEKKMLVNEELLRHLLIRKK